MKPDVYPNENIEIKSSLCYIHILGINEVGMLNRISSLMRKKRYNMEEVSVSFDEKGFAHFLIAVDGSKHDITQVMEQVWKLHDVTQVEDVSEKYEQIYYAVYVYSDNQEVFDTFTREKVGLVELKSGYKGVFMLNILEVHDFLDFLKANHFSYTKRIMDLVV